MLVWNCQDARNNKFQGVVKDLDKLAATDIIVIVETRISGLKAEEAIWRVEAQGFTGGIWNLPKVSRGCIHPSYKYMQFIHVRVV